MTCTDLRAMPKRTCDPPCDAAPSPTDGEPIISRLEAAEASLDAAWAALSGSLTPSERAELEAYRALDAPRLHGPRADERPEGEAALGAESPPAASSERPPAPCSTCPPAASSTRPPASRRLSAAEIEAAFHAALSGDPDFDDDELPTERYERRGLLH